MDISISEKRLEDYLFNHLNKSKVIASVEPEIPVIESGCVYRQFNMGSYGIADIVTIDTEAGALHPSITIYELKQGVIDESALIQVFRYKRGMEKYFDAAGYLYVCDPITCVLVGGGISQENDFNIAASSIQDLFIYTYDLCPNSGLSFERQSWFKDAPFPNSMNKAFLEIDYAAHDFEAQQHKNAPF